MQQRKISCLVALFISVIAILSFATASGAPNEQDRDASIQRISTQTAALEKQMRALQVQLRELKQQQAQLVGQRTTTNTSTKHTKAVSHHSKHHGKGSGDVLRSNPEGTLGSQLDTAKQVTRWMDIRGTTVVTSPYFGPQPQFDGSDMLVNTSSVNKDIVLLQMRKNINKEVDDAQKPAEHYSVLALSGELEGVAAFSRGYDKTKTSDVDLAAAEIDVAALVYPWLLGYMTLEYDNSSLPGATTGSGRRAGNSNFGLGQGFLTVGNLERSPIYFSLGQLYAPFGQYSSYMYSSPLTKVLGRAKVRGAVLGYDGITNNTGLYASVYTFSGDSRVQKDRNIDEGGANIGYRYRNGTFKTAGSVSVISNIADSNGMQSNGIDTSNQFSGFGANSSTERLKHRVPGIDIQGNINYGPFTIIGDYVSGLSSFSRSDMTYNGHGANPGAMHIEGAYNFAFYNRPGSFAVGYDRSWEALALSIPRDRISTTLSYSVWRNTLASLEYRYDMNYRNSDTAGGNVRNGPQTLIRPTGRQSNTVTFVLDYFF